MWDKAIEKKYQDEKSKLNPGQSDNKDEEKQSTDERKNKEQEKKQN